MNPYKTFKQPIQNLENNKINEEEYKLEREAVKKTMQKMEKELEKPAIRAVFQRLKNK